MHYEQKIKVPVYGSQCILFSKNDQVPSLSIHGLCPRPRLDVKCHWDVAQWASWKAKCAKIGVWLPPNLKFWGL